MSNKLLTALENLKITQDLVKFTDQKAAALMVVYGLVLTVFVEFSKQLKFVNVYEIPKFEDKFLSTLTLVVGVSVVIMLLVQIYIIVNEVLKPRLASNYNQNHQSVLYFEHISRMIKTNYIDSFMNLSDDNLVEEILAQTFEVAQIMTRKTERIRQAMKFLFFTIALLLVFILLTQAV